MRAQPEAGLVEDPSAVRRRQRGGRRFVRPVEEPGDRREIAAHRAQFVDCIEFESAVRPPAANAVRIDFVQRLLVTPGAAAVGDGVIERREVGERWRFAFVRRIAQMVVEAAVRVFPRRFVGPPQPFAEPFAHQRMGVERFGIGRVDRRQQPRLAQARDGAPPLVVAEADERVGQAGNRGPGAQRLEAVAARGAVEQADAMEDGEQDRLSGEPFLLVGFHHAPRLIVARIVGVGEQAADMVAPAHVAVLRFLDQAREQRQRERMAAEIMRGRFRSRSTPQTSLSRKSSAPASSDSLSTSTTGAAPSLKRWMSATARRLVSTIRL